ncbi:mandelate racemase/muconate lactonizing enzyme family protein [Coralliovum pocilloporae]|uniref:mandelate racemase/muconate lactonizing enzyme family protein n=1 Tax=Coralliovum pocilloporae TaxID=3066369 RepID=UPI00330725BD
MHLTAIDLYSVPLTSLETYYMADGKTCDTVESIVIRLTTDTGLEGWGEVCPIPHYLPAYAKGVAPAIQELAPILIGSDPVGPDALMARCDAHLQGHVYAKSALDMALWDLTAKAAGLPLYRLLGGRRAEAAPLYHSITCIAPDHMAAIARTAYQQGIRQFQVKLGASGGWSTDVERLKAVREAVGPGPIVYGDWNCGSTTFNAIRVGQAVRDDDIMLEQPCRTLEECAEVRKVTGLAMKIDESGHDTSSLLKARSLGCMDVVALKLSKFGGISALRRARDLCTDFGVMMVIEDTWGSDITTAAIAHMAVSTAPHLVLNTCDLSGYVTPHIASDGPQRDNAMLKPSERPGLGITPDTDVLGTPILSLS